MSAVENIDLAKMHKSYWITIRHCLDINFMPEVTQKRLVSPQKIKKTIQKIVELFDMEYPVSVVEDEGGKYADILASITFQQIRELAKYKGQNIADRPMLGTKHYIAIAMAIWKSVFESYLFEDSPDTLNLPPKNVLILHAIQDLARAKMEIMIQTMNQPSNG